MSLRLPVRAQLRKDEGLAGAGLGVGAARTPLRDKLDGHGVLGAFDRSGLLPAAAEQDQAEHGRTSGHGCLVRVGTRGL